MRACGGVSVSAQNDSRWTEVLFLLCVRESHKSISEQLQIAVQF